jgi:hypothetical protein
MAYTVYLCETVTGKNLGPLDSRVDSWHREINGTDTITVTLAPGALTTANRDWIRLTTTPARMSLVVEVAVDGSSVGIPLAAGPIWTREWDGKTLKLNASGIRSLLNRRKIHSWATPYAAQVASYTGMSLGTIAKRLVSQATDPNKGGSALPIVLPSDTSDADPTHTRNYNGYELKNVGDMLTELTGVINGPDIDFQPVWSDSNRTSINWQMRVGTPSQPKLFNTASVVFDASSPGSSVQQLTYVEDGSVMATSQWATASGQDVSTLMSFTTSTAMTSLGYPLLEQQQDYRTVSDQATLDTHTSGDLALHTNPTTQWTLSVNSTLPPVLGSFQLGDYARVRVANHLWIPDGDYSMRIIAMDGDSSMTVNLGVQGA